MKFINMILVILFILTGNAYSATYYIAPDGSDSSGAGTIASPWKSLHFSVGHLSVGDTLFVRGGEYTNENDWISTQASGTPGSPIVIQNYLAETPVFRMTGKPFDDEVRMAEFDHDYYIVDGLHFVHQNPSKTVNRGFAVKGNHNIFRNMVVKGFDMGGRYSFTNYQIFALYGSDNEISRSTLMNVGIYSVRGGQSGNVIHTWGHRNKIIDNHLQRGVHDVVHLSGDFNEVRRNIITHAMGYGVATDNGAHNLVEGNIISGSNEMINFVKNPLYNKGDHSIFRYNVAYNSGSYGYDQDKGHHVRYYNNVFYNNESDGFHWACGGTRCQDTKHVNNVVARNMIRSPQCDSYYAEITFNDINGTDGVHENYLESNYINARTPECAVYIGVLDKTKSVAYMEATYPTRWINNVSDGCDPKFTDALNGDFSLQAGSCLEDRGAHLTRTSASGSGTSLKVKDSYFFFPGDTLVIGGRETRTAVSVDYLSHTVTLDQSASWQNGESVNLPYSGQAPDIGAYEGDQGPTVAGGSAPIPTNDAPVGSEPPAGTDAPVPPPVSDPTTPDPSPSPSGLPGTSQSAKFSSYYEVEGMALSLPMVLGSGADASGGGYIESTSALASKSPTAEATLTISNIAAGDYFLWLRIFGLNDQQDALYVGMDSNHWDRVYPTVPGSYEWVRVETVHNSGQYIFHLSEGSHTLNIGHGEPGARADTLFLTNDASEVPTSGGTASPVVPFPSVSATITSSDPGIQNNSIEASGLLWDAEKGQYLLVSDEAIGTGPAVFMMDRNGVLTSRLSFFSNTIIDDLESISRDGGDTFIAASLSHNKSGLLKAKRTKLIRFKSDSQGVFTQDEIDLYAVLKQLVQDGPVSDVTRFLAKGINDHTMDIESHVVKQGALYLGFKAPLDSQGKTVILKLSDINKLFTGQKAVATIWQTLSIPDPETGVQSRLSDMVMLEDSLLLTSVTKSSTGFQSYLWRYFLQSKKLQKLNVFPGLKAEGVGNPADGESLMVVFDQGGGNPSKYQRVPFGGSIGSGVPSGSPSPSSPGGPLPPSGVRLTLR